MTAEVSTYAFYRNGTRKVMATQVKIDGEVIRFPERLDRATAIKLAEAGQGEKV